MTVSNQIIEVLDALCNKFGLAIDWSSQNILPYIQELTAKIVNYEFWTSIIWILIFIIFTIIFIITINNLIHTPNFNWIEDSPKTFFTVLFCIAEGIFLILFFSQIFDIITCITFPEQVVFDFISSTVYQLSN